MIDRSLRNMLLVGLALRVLPALAWPAQVCVRDECTYLTLAEKIVAGEGLVGTEGWLWAPAYPYLVALPLGWLDMPRGIIVIQILASLLTIVVIRALGARTVGPAAGRLAAWIWTLSPTVIFFTGHLWSETIYALLLVSAVACVGRAREGSLVAAAGMGLLVGLCVLFRGVASYMLPIFLGVLLTARLWRQALLAGAVAVLVVAPYSVYATRHHGGFVLSDRTMGQMMWLGNNTFEPITFDWGNGQIFQTQYNRVTATGRPHCDFEDEPVKQDSCEVARGMDWIAANPQTFVARMPLRVAQMLNPNTFLTRHLRMGRYKGLPQVLDEGLIIGTAALSMFTMSVGTLGIVAWGANWLGAVSALVVGYHVAAISALAGLTRYRFPLEPLWLLFACAFVVAPKESFRRLRGTRGALAVALTLVVVLEMLWFLPTGWMA